MQYCETLCCAGICMNETQTKCATCNFGKLNVVLDLDETLIHAEHKGVIMENCVAFCQFEDYKIYKRPFVDEFLNIVFNRYNVYIWTAAYKSYAKFVLAHLLDPKNQIPIKILTKDDTMIKKELTGLYYDDNTAVKIKPLGKLHCNLARTVLIDDTKSCFSLDPLNGIQIIKFDDPETQYDDKELLFILKKLDQASDLNDVRKKNFL